MAQPLDLPDGGRMTNNNKGMEMSTLSPLFEEWVQSYDGEHPLVDLGCAFGRNVSAAATRLAETQATTRVLAYDCDDSHLAYTRENSPPGVETAFAMAPDSLPSVKASGILIGEVLHFVDGDGIEATLSWARDALVPGGALCVTVGTAFVNFLPDANGNCPIQAAAQKTWEANAGAEWPGSQGINHQEIMASASRDEQLCGMPNKQLPTYYHPIAAKDLARACERAGLEVVLAREQFHPGWPSACPYDGRENAQVVARKKN